MPDEHSAVPGGTDAIPQGGDSRDSEVAELADVLERVAEKLEDVMDQLDRFGLKYARAYALTFYAPSPTVSWPHHPRDRVAGPPQGLSARCALLIRQIVLEEIQTGGN